MPVERHRGNAELVGEPPDRERVEALGVGERQRAVDHRVLAQPGPLCVARLCGCHRLTTIRRTRQDVKVLYNVQDLCTGTAYMTTEGEVTCRDAGGAWWPWRWPPS